LWRDAALVAGKDLRIEARSRVATSQVVPFALLVLVVFAFALDPDRGFLAEAAAGLFWVAVLFAGLLAIQRSFAVEAQEGTRDVLRLSGLDPAGLFLGKAGAIAVELVVMEAVLALGVVVLYDTRVHSAGLLVMTMLLATVGLAASGTLYGVLAAIARAAGRRAGRAGGHARVRPRAGRAGARDLAVGQHPRRLRRRLRRVRRRRVRAAPGGGVTTSSRSTRALGLLALAGLVATAVMGLWVTPPDVNQQDAVRLLYVHVPAAWLALYVAFGVTTLASALYLWPRTRARRWDLLAGASAEIGVLFLGLTLLVGSIWGRTTWGVWWTWDARLTTTAVLFVLYLGYLALRRVPGDVDSRSRRVAVVALGDFLVVPIVHQSVEWWRTLHQPATILDENRILHPRIHGSMAWTLLLGVVAFTLLYAWLLVHRYRVAALEEEAEARWLDDALAERRSEAELAEVS
jgi:heme exporter protein C